MTAIRDPERWGVSSSECPPELRTLLTASKQEVAPIENVARVRAAVLAATVGGVAAVGVARNALLAKSWLVVLGVTVGLLAVPVWFWQRGHGAGLDTSSARVARGAVAPRPRALPEPGLEQQAPSSPVTPPAAVALVPAPEPTRVASASRSESAARPATRASKATPRISAVVASAQTVLPARSSGTGAVAPVELELLAAARHAMHVGDYALAQNRLDAHAHAFANGLLVEEREALRVEVLYRSGHHALAHTALDAFVRRFAGSTYEAQLRELVVD